MNTSFDRIVGYKEEKVELEKYAYILKNKENLIRLGGKMPKGLMLVGPNGVGKTVLAKALIKESGCNVVEINLNNASTNREINSLIKEKFLEASKFETCILYVDELDKIIGQEVLFMSENSEASSNTILNELNRYSDSGIFFLAVCNEKKILDESIVRSGRIDSILEINKPNESERKDIVDYYLKGKKVAKEVNSKELAKVFSDFSGADIEATINNSLIKCFVENRNEISKDDLMSVYYNKIFQSVSKEEQEGDKNIDLIAIHEAGHAATNLLLDKNSIACASILSRNDVKGFVNSIDSENELQTISKLINKIKINLAGKISEELIADENSVGASRDLKTAQQIVSEIVRTLGYAGVDYLDFESKRAMFGSDQTSQARLEKIENKETEILKDLYKETKELLENNLQLIHMIKEGLLKRKVLNKEELLSIYDNYSLINN